jgi:membrane protease YdiL (CAAX protease family)
MAAPVPHLTFAGIALALAGPGVIAWVSNRFVGVGKPLEIRALGLLAFVVLVAVVVVIAIRGEGLRGSDVGFGRVSWRTPLWATVLTVFFVVVFGPVAVWTLARLGFGSFAQGQSTLAGLPTWYIVVAIVVVAASEEWLARGYAIERLEALTGSAWIAGAVSLFAFGLAHLPIWGLGASLTTLVSGAIFTALYIWRRDVVFLMLAHVATDLYGLVIAR